MDEFFKKLTHNGLLNHKRSPNHKIFKITSANLKNYATIESNVIFIKMTTLNEMFKNKMH
jgi:hypothetical protein